MTTCDQFATFATQFDGTGLTFGNVPITDVEVDDDTATVSTLESMGVDGDGLPTVQAFDYTLVRFGDTWLVDQVEFGD